MKLNSKVIYAKFDGLMARDILSSCIYFLCVVLKIVTS